MSPDQIVEQVRESAGEWLEMSENPDHMVAGILAQRVIDLNEYIEYLERRLVRYEHCV